MSFTVPKDGNQKKNRGRDEFDDGGVGAQPTSSVDENIGKVSIIGGWDAESHRRCGEGVRRVGGGKYQYNDDLDFRDKKSSCVINEDEIDRAVRILHDVFRAWLCHQINEKTRIKNEIDRAVRQPHCETERRAEEVAFSLDDKLRIAEALGRLWRPIT